VLKYVTKSTISGINQTGLKQLEIMVPTLLLQAEFVQVVRKYERVQAQQREAERQAEQLFAALLAEAFRE
jgi:type I restriction enzyme S subunit